MSFAPQNDLERSLVRAATDPAHRPQFCRDFLDASLLVIDSSAAAVVQWTQVPLPEPYRPRQINWKGRPFLSVFSSLPRIQHVVRSPQAYAEITGRQFLKSTRGADIILNPGSDYGKELLKAEVGQLLAGSIDRVLRQETTAQVILGTPLNQPRELIDALTNLLAAEAGVSRAWLARCIDADRHPTPFTVVGIETQSDWEGLASRAIVAAATVEVPEPPVEFVRVMGREGFRTYFIRQRPFWMRA